MFKPDQQVRHEAFGTGTVILNQGDTVIVRFQDRIESCEPADLTLRLGLEEAIRVGQDHRSWSDSLAVALERQGQEALDSHSRLAGRAMAISSANSV